MATTRTRRSMGPSKSIVAYGLTRSMSDCLQLVPLVDAVRANLGHPGRFRRTLAIAVRTICCRSRPGRSKHPAETTRKVGGEMTQKVRQKLKHAGYRSRYRLRKQIVEPVLGRSSKHVDFDNSSCIALRHAGRVAADLHHP
jgi:hypothetical protein